MKEPTNLFSLGFPRRSLSCQQLAWETKMKSENSHEVKVLPASNILISSILNQCLTLMKGLKDETQ